MKKLLLLVPLFFFLGLLCRPKPLLAYYPASTNYRLQNYSIGGGGTASSSSTTYSLFGSAGEVDNSLLTSTNFKSGNGLMYTLVASVPATPTFTNPSNFYNKLKVVLNQSKDPSDFTYAIAISKDNFVTDKEYIQADNTISTNFSVLNFRSYTNWGGGSGTTIVGLSPNTTYTVKVASRQGFYTQSPWGPTASVATINPTFSFSVSSSNANPQVLSIGQIVPGTVRTSTDTVTVTMSTNANNGGTIYLYDANNGLTSSTRGYTITSATADLSSASQGYGAQSTAVTQTSGGPMEVFSPYNGSGNNVGIISTTKRLIYDSTSAPVTSGQGTFDLQAKAGNTAPEGPDYADTLTIIGAGSY